MNVDELFQILEEGDEEDKWFAAEILGVELDNDSFQEIVRFVDDEDVDEVIVWILGQMEDERAVPVLLEKLQHTTDTYVIHRTVKALKNIGEAARRPMCRFLSDRSNADEARWRIARALGDLGDARSFPFLWENVQDKNKYVRWRCTYALTQLGGDVVPQLEEKLNVESPYLRWRALWVLGEIGDGRVEEPITSLLAEGESQYVRWQAKQALQKIQR